MAISSSVYKAGLLVSALGVIISLAGMVMQSTGLWHPGLVIFITGFAIGAGHWPGLRSYQFTLWIIAGFVAAMIYSKDLIIWGGFNITHKWIVFLVIQATMFSM